MVSARRSNMPPSSSSSAFAASGAADGRVSARSASSSSRLSWAFSVCFATSASSPRSPTQFGLPARARQLTTHPKCCYPPRSVTSTPSKLCSLGAPRVDAPGSPSHVRLRVRRPDRTEITRARSDRVRMDCRRMPRAFAELPDLPVGWRGVPQGANDVRVLRGRLDARHVDLRQDRACRISETWDRGRRPLKRCARASRTGADLESLKP